MIVNAKEMKKIQKEMKLKEKGLERIEYLEKCNTCPNCQIPQIQNSLCPDCLNIFNKGKQEGYFEALQDVRKLMVPHHANCKKSVSTHFIAGSYRNNCEEYVLINLRQRVLHKISRLEKLKELEE